MHKIAILGGTGMTGQCAVQQALKKGLQVNLLYRNENTVPDDFKNDKVQLIKGDATNLDDVKRVVTGTDGVVIVLGTRNNLEPTTELSTGTKNVIEAMKQLGLEKVSVCLSSFLFWDQSKVPQQFNNINNEHKKMLELLEQSDLKYIAVHPPHIADEPSTELTILHDASPGRVVSKWDLAKFLVDCLEDEKYFRKKWGLAKKA